MQKTKTKQKIIYNFIDSNVMKKIWERMEIFSEETRKLAFLQEWEREKIQHLLRENAILLTSIMFIVENFDKRVNLLEVGRRIRINFMYANLYFIQARLRKSQKILRNLEYILQKKSMQIDLFSDQLWFERARKKYLLNRINSSKVKLSKIVFFANLSMQVIRDGYKILEIFHQDILGYVLENKDLKVWDVILSYKTQPYLNNAHLSRLISIAQKSNITHSSVISRVEWDIIEHINPTPDNNHIIVSQLLKNKKNEVFFVMRPKLSQVLLDQYRDEIEILRQEILEKKAIYRFSELKQWYAVIGWYLSINIIYFFRRIISLNNIFRNKKSFFCSELIDYLFKKIGIFLIPRSQFDSIIWPSELLYSPFLELIGVIYNKDEVELIKLEDFIMNI